MGDARGVSSGRSAAGSPDTSKIAVLITSHGGRVLHSVETNEKANPVAIGFISTEAIALDSEGSFHLLHQFIGCTHAALVVVFKYRIVRYSKSRKHANFGYAAKICFATKGVNGVDLTKWLHNLNERADTFIEVMQQGV